MSIPAGIGTWVTCPRCGNPARVICYGCDMFVPVDAAPLDPKRVGHRQRASAHQGHARILKKRSTGGLMNKLVAGAVLIATAGTLAACGSQADTVAKNISKEAEKFNVQRRIVGINGITDKVEFEVEGRCSLESADSALAGSLEITCKHGPDDYRKHYIGMSDNVFFISTQLKGIDVSEYRTKIILKPQGLIPDLDLVTG